MDWSKLDARLALALAEDDPSSRFAVFVQVDPGADLDSLLGVLEPGEGPVCTAALSPDEIGRLSEHPEIRKIGLSTRLRPVDEP